MTRRLPLALALIVLVATLAGCGGGSTAGQGEPASTGATTAAESVPDERAVDREEQERSKHSGRREDEEPAKKAEKPEQKRNRVHESKAAREAAEQVERLQEQVSKPLTRKDLRRIAEHQVEWNEKVANPPPGETALDVLREIEEEVRGRGP